MPDAPPNDLVPRLRDLLAAEEDAGAPLEDDPDLPPEERLRRAEARLARGSRLLRRLVSEIDRSLAGEEALGARLAPDPIPDDAVPDPPTDPQPGGPAAPGKVYLAPGARGALVERLQERLQELSFDPRGVDGAFGKGTRGALELFQRDRGLAATGEVDEPTWRVLFAGDPPPPFERALAVTAAFEGHGYTHAAGNWDGAGITWGIVGFTLEHGALGEIARRVHATHPELLAEDFGPTRSLTLLENLAKSPAERVAWADGISLTDDKRRLYKPWTEAFERFGARPEVQAVQREVAEERYGRPARKTAAALGLVSELGLALAFDAHIQNGGVKKDARRLLDEARAETPPESERDLRRLVAYAVADSARARFRDDVLSRKLTLAEGEGVVHGRRYDLRNWGLDETPVAAG